jgi:dUTP pyrophosphatase
LELEIAIQRLEHYPKDLPLPSYMSEHASGMDLRAAIAEGVEIRSLERVLVPTGIALAIPPGMEAQIRPRSGLAIKRGLTILNTPGTIDSDYRGEIKVICVNLSNQTALIEPGERVAQMVFAHVSQIKLKEVKELTETLRGGGGFGHTGNL